MIPGTLPGLILFAASLGPGFVYVSIADRHRPRPSRSQLGEAVEMIAIGGLFSAIAAMIVLAVGAAWGAFEADRLDSSHYLLAHPTRALGAICAFLALGYGASWVAAKLMHRGVASHEPGRTAWQKHLWLLRPSPEALSVVTVELRDGRKIVGVLGGFTSQLENSRELALVAPIAVTGETGGPFVETKDAYFIIREQDVLYVAGRYHSAS